MHKAPTPEGLARQRALVARDRKGYDGVGF